MGAESGLIACDFENREFLDLDLHWLEANFLIFAGEFVGWNAGNLLGGKRRWRLLQLAAELGGQRPDFFERRMTLCAGAVASPSAS